MSPPSSPETTTPPWRFEPFIYGLRNVVLTASGSVLACNVPTTAGPLLAAAPSLLAVVERIAELSTDQDSRKIAAAALERYHARQARVRDDGFPVPDTWKSLFANVITCN